MKNKKRILKFNLLIVKIHINFTPQLSKIYVNIYVQHKYLADSWA